MRTARGTALEVLIACRKDGAWADGALKTAISKNQLTVQDAALTTHIVYGVLQNRMLIDFTLSAYCTQKPAALEPILLDILRIGAYQILFLDRVPGRAAVNESVELAKSCGKAKAAGLVNAVLRKVSDNKDALPQPKSPELATKLSILYSHPKWLVARLLTLIGEQETRAFLAGNNAIAALAVQVNSLKTDVAGLSDALQSEGVTVQKHPWLPDCLILSGSGNPATLSAFHDGLFYVQDPAARLVSFAATPKPGDFILDVCAAPGGKSFAMALSMENKGKIIACDLYPHKLELIEAGAKRLNLDCIETALQDGREKNEAWQAAADVVLVDAPCSGLGIIRKKPDIRYKNPEELAALPKIQSAILENAAAYVKPGGVLVYSTCTILPEENQQVTAAFLAAHPDFSPEEFTLPAPLGTIHGDVTLFPQREGTDGFYICRMRRTKA